MYADVLGGSSDRWFTDVLEQYGVLPTELVQIDGTLQSWGTFESDILTFVHGTQNEA